VVSPGWEQLTMLPNAFQAKTHIAVQHWKLRRGRDMSDSLSLHSHRT
jgi:hypothetical protein